MSYHKIKLFLDRLAIKNYIINIDDTVDVDGDVNLSYKRLEFIPVKFNRVNGDFICSNNILTSLKNSPVYVGGSFRCGYNAIDSLDHSPLIVNGMYDVSHNRVTSFLGAPKTADYIKADFTDLTSLDYCPSGNNISLLYTFDLNKTAKEYAKLFPLGYTPEQINNDDVKNEVLALYRQYTIENIIA